MAEDAIFTALPVGRVDSRLAVTVFVTPRLAPANAGTTDPLSAFAAFSDWPSAVRGATWRFEVEGVADALVGVPVGSPPVVPDSGLWERLFGGTRVGDGGFQDYSGATVVSHPAAAIAASVEQLYGEVAVASPTEFPSLTDGPLGAALDRLRSSRFVDEVVQRITRASRRRLRELRDAPGGGTLKYFDFGHPSIGPADVLAVELAAVAAFYDRTPEGADPGSIAEPAAERPEFHSFVARCADFPRLLRHLGLAIDLTIDDHPAIHQTAKLRVASATGTQFLEQLVGPERARATTVARRTADTWAASGEEDDVEDGTFKLHDPERFLVAQVDPDAAALKLVDFVGNALSLREHAGDPGVTTVPDSAALPALRSTGIMVARHDRGEQLVAHLEDAADHELHRQDSPLTAADVTRGVRVDVADLSTGGSWHSLHRRVGDYRLQGPSGVEPLGVELPADEGYVKAASTTSVPQDPADPNATDLSPSEADDQYLHEAVTGWDGWSLAVQRPGLPVGELEPADAAALGQVDDTGFRLAADFRVVPGSLPRLRFGHRYRLRMRAVDLSGASLPEAQVRDDFARDLDGGTYQRWEPVPAPAVVPRTEFTEGESLTRLVIRSTLGATPAEYVDLPHLQELGIEYRAANERHLAPPQAAMQLCETHGVFDAAIGGTPQAIATQFDLISEREAGSYLTAASARIVPGGTPDTTPAGQPPQLRDGAYVVHDVHELGLPYLPDPLARGVSFTTLPGDTSTRLARWRGDPGTWHERKPMRLRIVHAPGTATVMPDADPPGLIEVGLPQATIATVRVASFLDAGDPELLRIFQLIREHAADDTAPTGETWHELATQGRHWMLTPFVELTLVHAVERPLEAPVVVLDDGAKRPISATWATFPGSIACHARSTGRLDVDAAWSEPIDDPTTTGPASVDGAAHVGDFSIEASEDQAGIGQVEEPTAPGGPIHELVHEFGDTRHRRVRYTATATTRFREYFPSTITDRAELVTSRGPELTVDVPSSARPDAPDVRYVVPTWEWQREPMDVPGSPFARRSVRTGGGLRVYLGRPWYSSGDGELLGVVLRAQPWITWPRDLAPGDAGTLVDDADARAVADEWAATWLSDAGVGVSATESPAGRLTSHLTDAAEQVAESSAHLRPTSDPDDRFLVAAERVADKRRRGDPALRAERVSAAMTKGLARDLPLPRFTTDVTGLPFTSFWGSDPVFASHPPSAGPFIHQFTRRTASRFATLAEVDTPVTVVGHHPEFDPDRGLWFCDLQVEAGESYTPFVRLSLVRFQPRSVLGVHISAVAQADPVQLVPRREATFVLAADGRRMAVTMSGPVGAAEHASTAPEQFAGSRRVEAWVERRAVRDTTDLAWEEVGERAVLGLVLPHHASGAVDPREARFVGAVALPDRATGEELRVRLAEYELHSTEPAEPAGVVERRLVYAEDVTLP